MSEQLERGVTRRCWDCGTPLAPGEVNRCDPCQTEWDARRDAEDIRETDEAHARWVRNGARRA